MYFRIQELQQEVHQLQEKLAMMESGLRDYNKQVGFSFICILGVKMTAMIVHRIGLYYLILLIVSFYTTFVFFINFLIEFIAGMA